jgi:hypothetical protein
MACDARNAADYFRFSAKSANRVIEPGTQFEI